MTLREFFEYIGQNPSNLLLYFAGIPFLALLLGFIFKDEGHVSPVNYLYAALLFGVCVPGIFSIALSVYFFLFERGSLLNANLYTQVLPVVSMFSTIGLMNRNVDLSQVPGSSRLTSLMMMIGAIIVLMWLLDKTRIIAFAVIPVQFLLLLVVGLVLVFRFALGGVLGKK